MTPVRNTLGLLGAALNGSMALSASLRCRTLGPGLPAGFGLFAGKPAPIGERVISEIYAVPAGLAAKQPAPIHQVKLAKCACIRAASAWRPLNSSNAFTAWNTAMLLPSSVRQPSARAARSSSVSSGK